MKSIAKTDTPHRCELPDRRIAYVTSMPAQEILQCECGQNWWMTWSASPAGNWFPVEERISERQARRLTNRWKKP